MRFRARRSHTVSTGEHHQPVAEHVADLQVLVISSIGGTPPAPHLLPYVAAKHAAVGFAEGLRVEAIRHGITVTCAVPGLMRTGSPRNATPDPAPSAHP